MQDPLPLNAPSPTYPQNSVAVDYSMVRDWRNALKTQPKYHRFGNRTCRFNYNFVFLVLCVITLILLFYGLRPISHSAYNNSITNNDSSKWMPSSNLLSISYNYTYPLSAPINSNGMQTYRIALIADLDKSSKDEQHKYSWRSYLKKGYLSYSNTKKSVVVSFDNDNRVIEIVGGYSLNGRGMELSELVTFNGRILTFDDRTGIVYELNDDKVIPWVLLMDGAGKTSKGFKSEWATVKDEVLYVGSMGKEWTSSTGEFESFDPMYVKAITTTGEVRTKLYTFNYKFFRHHIYIWEKIFHLQVHHLKWVAKYKAIRSILGIDWPGYMIHESAAWSPIHRKWFFLPRRCSKERYDEVRDEHMGCNVLITADENFHRIEQVKLANYKSTHGFSSFKFIPGSDDSVIVALQTEEINGTTATYITSFTIDGKILVDSLKLNTNLKYEGIEFI